MEQEAHAVPNPEQVQALLFQDCPVDFRQFLDVDLCSRFHRYSSALKSWPRCSRRSRSVASSTRTSSIARTSLWRGSSYTTPSASMSSRASTRISPLNSTRYLTFPSDPLPSDHSDGTWLRTLRRLFDL